MVTLHLGVIEFEYAHEQKREKPLKPGRKRTVHKKQDAPIEFVTTAQVATWLEREYHLMQVFYEQHADKINAYALEAIENQILNLMAGAPSESAEKLFVELEDQVTIMFKRWLSTGGPEAAGIPGVPTKAAQTGIPSHRKKHPWSAKNGPRESFIDSGTFETSFRAWID